VACNLADQPRRVPIGYGRPRDLLLSSHGGIGLRPDALDMPPDSVVILGWRDTSASEEGSTPCPGSS